jgi:hypothetical protein
MTDSSVSVGAAIAAALERGERLRKASVRKPRVRIATAFGDDHSGLTISARIAARSNEEVMAQENLGTRRIPFADLDGGASELVALVDEVVGEVEAAVKNAASPAAPPSKIEPDLDRGAFERFTEACAKALTEEASALLKSPAARNLSLGVAGEAVMDAALGLVALAAFSARIGPEDVHDALRTALSDVRGRAVEGASYLMRTRLDS